MVAGAVFSTEIILAGVLRSCICVMTDGTNPHRSADSLVGGEGGSGTGVIIVNVGPAVEPTRLR